MNTPCLGQDEKLLMMAHGQLGIWQKIVLKIHMKGCPACRARLGRFSQLSAGLSLVMASPSGPRSLPYLLGLKVSARSALLGVLALIMVLGVWTLRSNAQATEVKPPVQKAVAPPKHCGTEPVLPTRKKCRSKSA